MLEMLALKKWLQLLVISILAASVQVYLSGRQFTYLYYFMSVLMALLASYLAATFCDYWHMDESLKTGVIGVSAYLAPHILEGLNNIGKRFAKDPVKTVNEIVRRK